MANMMRLLCTYVAVVYLFLSGVFFGLRLDEMGLSCLVISALSYLFSVGWKKRHEELRRYYADGIMGGSAEEDLDKKEYQDE